MSQSRLSWLSGLVPSFVSNLFYGSQTSSEKKLGDAKDSLSDSSTVTNVMERLKAELLSYAENFSSHRAKVGEIREHLLLLQKDQERKEQKSSENAVKLESHVSINTAVKGLEGLIKQIETTADPLLAEIMREMYNLSDAASVIKLCDDAIKLINEIDVGIVKVKGFLQDARDNKSFWHGLLNVMIALAKLPNLLPDSLDERNDDKLYEAIQPVTSGFFKWLSSTKVDLIKAETEAGKFLKAQQEALAKKTSDSTSQSVERKETVKSSEEKANDAKDASSKDTLTKDTSLDVKEPPAVDNSSKNSALETKSTLASRQTTLSLLGRSLRPKPDNQDQNNVGIRPLDDSKGPVKVGLLRSFAKAQSPKSPVRTLQISRPILHFTTNGSPATPVTPKNPTTPPPQIGRGMRSSSS